MYFQTLSHAGLRVVAAGKELVCDPWLVGSTYWRSWWNYPPVPKELVASLKPDFIYLTHLHWDHFQSVSLKRFDPETPVLIPYDRYERFTRDLRKIGMRNVRELRHGERFELAPGFAIRSFHFAPFVTDSAVVIEAEGVTLLNANDAKFAGAPLDQILRFYPKVDFCLRSHSSANPRACYHYLDSPEEQSDDNEHYLRAFALFMARVKPRYAIPFASNSCLLHDDVYAFNHLTQTPHAVADYFERFARERGLTTKLQIMIPGDKWDSDKGFVLQDHDWFEDRPAKLAKYRERVGPALQRQAEFEARVQVAPKLVQDYFAELARNVPGSFTRKLKGREVLLVSRSEKGTDGFAVDLSGGGKVRKIPAKDFDSFAMRIEFPAVILRQALAMNMFEHAGISKRVHYYATREAMPALRRFDTILKMAEAELFPLRRHLNRRTIHALVPRWREGLLYVRVIADLARGADLPSLEEKYLENA
jgi:UDP-MurNAc hydroxylase